MPTLAELDARFMRSEVETTTERDEERGLYVFRGDDGEPLMWSPRPERDTLSRVETLAEAQGLWFDCPKCWLERRAGKDVGVHAVLVWFSGRGVVDRLGKDSKGKTVRWDVSAKSTGLADLSLSPSILLAGPGCGWHGFVGSSGVPPGHAA